MKKFVITAEPIADLTAGLPSAAIEIRMQGIDRAGAAQYLRVAANELAEADNLPESETAIMRLHGFPTKP